MQRSEGENSVRMRSRAGAVIRTARENPSLIRYAGTDLLVAAVGSGVGYDLASHSHTTGGIILSVVAATLTAGVATVPGHDVTRAVERAVQQRKLTTAEPGTSVTLTKRGSLREAWRTGEVQSPQTTIYTKPEIEYDADGLRTTPIQEWEIRRHAKLVLKKNPVYGSQRTHYEVGMSDNTDGILAVTTWGTRPLSFISIVRSRNPQAQGYKSVYPYSEIKTVVENDSAQVFFETGNYEGPNMVRIPNLRTDTDPNPHDLTQFSEHLALLEGVGRRQKIK